MQIKPHSTGPGIIISGLKVLNILSASSDAEKPFGCVVIDVIIIVAIESRHFYISQINVFSYRLTPFSSIPAFSCNRDAPDDANR